MEVAVLELPPKDLQAFNRQLPYGHDLNVQAPNPMANSAGGSMI